MMQDVGRPNQLPQQCFLGKVDSHSVGREIQLDILVTQVIGKTQIGKL